MKQKKDIQNKYYGNEAPGGKEVVIAIAGFLLLTILSWIAYFKFGWLH